MLLARSLPPAFRGGVLLANGEAVILTGNDFDAPKLGVWQFSLSDSHWRCLCGSDQDGPIGRRMFAAALYLNKVVCFGGKSRGKYLEDLWVFNLQTNKWQLLDQRNHGPNAKPPARYASAFAADAQVLWFFGGLGERGLYNDLWCFHFADNSFELIEPGDPVGGIQNNAFKSRDLSAPSRRYGATMVKTDSKLYVFGGYTSRKDLQAVRRLFNDVWEYDLRQRRWSCLHEDSGYNYWEPNALRRDAPLGRYCSVIGYDNRRIYVSFGDTGGESGFGWKHLSDSWFFDLTHNPGQWHPCKIPSKVMFLGAGGDHFQRGLKAPAFCQNQRFVYVYGGETAGDHASMFFALDLSKANCNETVGNLISDTVR